MSYEVSPDACRLNGDYAGKILKVAGPADLLVQQAARGKLIINNSTVGN